MNRPSLLENEDEQSSDHGSTRLPDHGVKLQGKGGQASSNKVAVKDSLRVGEENNGSSLLAQALFSVEQEAHTVYGWEQVTGLVNEPTRDTAKLAYGLPWVSVEKNGIEIFSNYYTEAKDKRSAARRAKKMLAEKLK